MELKHLSMLHQIAWSKIRSIFVNKQICQQSAAEKLILAIPANAKT